MPVSLTTVADVLRAGLRVAFYKKDHADDVVTPYDDQPHLLHLIQHGAIKTLSDLDRLPRIFDCGGISYVESTVSAGWEYPQGWGRTRDNNGNIVYDEPNARADGKVETFRTEQNQARQELDKEISNYFDRKSKQ